MTIIIHSISNQAIHNNMFSTTQNKFNYVVNDLINNIQFNNTSAINIIENPYESPIKGEIYKILKSSCVDFFYDVYFEDKLCDWFFKIEFNFKLENMKYSLCKYFDSNGQFKKYFYIPI